MNQLGLLFYVILTREPELPHPRYFPRPATDVVVTSSTLATQAENQWHDCMVAHANPLPDHVHPRKMLAVPNENTATELFGMVIAIAFTR